MIWDSFSYALHYPMAPLGGVFVAVMGAFVMLGSIVKPLRIILVFVGMGAAALALFLCRKLSLGLPPATAIQIGSLILAIVVEIGAFRILIPRIRSHSERAILGTTLAIVGAHFLIMLPAFGPLIGGTGVLCLLNAWLLMRFPSYQAGGAWFVDGFIKLAIGGALMLTSPIF